MDESRFLKVGLDIDVPIIGIGAPIHAWLPVPAKKLGVDPVISKSHEVANAVGAAAGKVMNIHSVLIQNHNGEYLSIFAPWGKRDVLRDDDNEEEAPKTVEEMVEPTSDEVIAETKQRLREEMMAQGIYHYDILVERKDSRVSRETCKLFIESRIDVIAVGLPSWAEKEKERGFVF